MSPEIESATNALANFLSDPSFQTAFPSKDHVLNELRKEGHKQSDVSRAMAMLTQAGCMEERTLVHVIPPDTSSVVYRGVLAGVFDGPLPQAQRIPYRVVAPLPGLQDWLARRSQQSQAPLHPGSTMQARYTLGQLILDLQSIDAALQANTRTADRHAGNPMELFWRMQAAGVNSATMDQLSRRPGIGRIRIYCDEMGGGLTADNVRKLRARICHARTCLPNDADALSLEDAADVLADLGGEKAKQSEGTEPNVERNSPQPMRNRHGHLIKPCPGCGSLPAAEGEVDDVCPQCGEYTYSCALIRHYPLAEGAEPIIQQIRNPDWTRLPPSQVRKPAPAADRSKRKGGGRTPLPETSPLFQVYKRIHSENGKPSEKRERLEADKDFMEIFKASGAKWKTVFKNARAYFAQPGKKQENPPT
jgi:hypothetical protein